MFKPITTSTLTTTPFPNISIITDTRPVFIPGSLKMIYGHNK